MTNERIAKHTPPLIYFVATVTRYVLVEAVDEIEAREKGVPALRELYAETPERRDAPIEIHTVRPATAEEISLMRWHEEMVARASNG